jgi:hypothetical protein
MTLNTRKPTGIVPWPLILVEGGEKCGKSFSCALLSASKKVGRTLWLDWAEGAADEYGAIPGVRYEVIEHDGSWASIIGQVVAAKEEAQRAKDAGEPPVVLIIDSITAEWESLKDWASDRARTQRANREKLQRDPGAEVTISMNLWNDAAARHRRLMTILMTFPGIVVITARAGEIAAVENGKPVEGRKSYRVEGHKSLAYDASCWVRLARDARPIVVGARSVHAGVRPGIDPPQALPSDWTLEWLVFDALKCNPATAHVRDLAGAPRSVPTPEQLRDEALETTTTFDRVKELHAIADQHYRDVTLMNGEGEDEPLTVMLLRIGNERRGGGAVQRPQTRPAAGDAFDESAPAAPRQNGYGSAPRGQVSRPAQPQPTPPPPAGVDQTAVTEWAAKIDKIATGDDADRAEDELREVRAAGQVDARTADAIRKAIRAKRESVAGRETAAA